MQPTANGGSNRPNLLQISLNPVHKAFGIVHNLCGILNRKWLSLQIVILLFTDLARLDI